MNPDDWKEFINGLFVRSDGSRKSAHLSITLTADEGEIKLPATMVSHTDTLQQIFQRIRDENVSTVEEITSDNTTTSSSNQADTLPKRVNVEHIKHGKTEYLVSRMSDNSFLVQKPDGEEVAPKTIIYNTVVKKYREQFKLD